MNHKLILGVLIIGLFVFSFATAIYNQNKCEPIDYTNQTKWDDYAKQGLFPIRNIDGTFIKYPIGCE